MRRSIPFSRRSSPIKQRITAVFAIGLLSLAPPVLAELRVETSPFDIVAEATSYINLHADAPIEIGDLPDHPKLHWIGTAKIPKTDGTYGMTVHFVPRAAGTIELPALPVTIGGVRSIVDCPTLTAKPNQQPDGATDLIVAFDGTRDAPTQVWVGQKLDLDILALIPPQSSNEQSMSARIAALLRGSNAGPRAAPLPRVDVSLADWKNYALPYPNGDPRFYPFGGVAEPFQESQMTLDGLEYGVRRYRCRCLFSAPGIAEGQIALSLKARDEFRTHIIKFDMEVKNLPPPPLRDALPTGLVGDWKFKLTHEPPQPKAGEPFLLSLDIEGTGDPLTIEDIDFSGVGFPQSSANTEVHAETNAERWKATLRQTLLPTGDIPRFPAVTLLSFDTNEGAWRRHDLSPMLAVEGATPASAALAPTGQLGTLIARPILLNLHPLVFALFALGPLIPITTGLIARAARRRDPEKAKRKRAMQSLIKQLAAGNDDPSLIDDELLPLLRERFELPSGATANELATTLETEHPDLADHLRKHAAASFGSRTSGLNPSKLASALRRVSLVLVFGLLFLSVGIAPAELPELAPATAALEAGRYDEAVEIYQTLISENPGRPGLYLDLARAHLTDGDPARARAACHTALLLDPLDADGRDLMDMALERMGESALPGSRLLALRPDQFLMAAAVLWFAAFVVLAIRCPRWPAAILFILALACGALALWRNSGAYANGQMMVVVDELPREPEVGVPSWDSLPLQAGQIIRPTKTTETHAHVEGAGAPFWVPLNGLRTLW